MKLGWHEFFAILLFITSLCLVTVVATSDELALEDEIERAAMRLNPSMSPARASSLAPLFVDAGHETGIDPLLLVALAFRESGLRRGVVGDLGEQGLLQVHGIALRHRPRGCRRELQSEACEVRTGAAYLQWVSALCPGSTARWVCSYGRSSCCSEEAALDDDGTRRARRFHRSIGGMWD